MQVEIEKMPKIFAKKLKYKKGKYLCFDRQTNIYAGRVKSGCVRQTQQTKQTFESQKKEPKTGQ